ncbi:hypothetical protein FGG08_003858 [Glutinoglossum americanum]|uniref:Nephrocystin 3-like N-terminal domain-containing protein n=1 Tax=Glutinoglossum americanum TaxID=1670608 RepID=A0A9P8I1N8_9PEZI|nr:hypothetical protein FGG08_003858 [Glutinoglossum americanum]
MQRRVSASIVNALSLSSTNDLMEAVRSGSLYADVLEEGWRQQLNDFKIVSLYEGIGNDVAQIVSRESASFGLPGDVENIVRLKADHSNMCRFDTTVQADLDNFKIVRGNMHRLYMAAMNRNPAPTATSMVQPNPQPPGQLIRRDTAVSSVDIPLLPEAVSLSALGVGEQRNFSFLFSHSSEMPLMQLVIPSYVRSFRHYDYEKGFERIDRERHPNTCQWISQNENIKWWSASRRNSLLWLSGDPGLGKSTLLTYLTHLLRGRPRHLNVGKNSAVIYSFCNEQANNTGSMVLSVAIHQMLTQFPHLQHRAYEPDQAHCLGNTRWRVTKGKHRSVAGLWHLLCQLAKESRLSRVFLIVDALDECDKGSQVELIQLFYRAVPCLKVLVSSRPSEELRTAFSKWMTHSPETIKCLKAEDEEAHVNDDIDRYIHGEVERIGKLRGHSPQQSKMIIERLAQDRSRIFLPVALLFNRLELEPTSELARVLEETPNDLQVLYERLLSQIPSSVRSRPSAIFKYLIHACTPLTVRELAFASSTDQDRAHCEEMMAGFLSDSHLTSFRKDLLLYGPILRIRQDDDTVNFIHVSVKEFLVERSLSPMEPFLIEPRQAQKGIAADCLKLLLSKAHLVFPGPWDRGFIDAPMAPEHVLLGYASQYWYEHLKQATLFMPSVEDVDPELLSLARDLADLWKYPSTLGFRALLLSRSGFHGLNKQELEKISPIEVFSALGLSSFLQVLLREITGSASYLMPSTMSALTLAIKGGHESTVDIIVDRFKISSLESPAFGDVVADSAWTGRPGPLRKVLELRKARTHKLVEATTAAFLTGQHATLAALTADRSIFEDRNQFDMTVLHVLFVKNLQNYQLAPDTALAIALYYITNKVDIKATDVLGNTALHYACWGRYFCTAELIRGLVEKGADIHCRNYGGLTPFHFAARYVKRLDAIEALLQIGGNGIVAAASNGKMTPLHWAVARWCGLGYEDSEPVIRTLLSRGADMQATNSRGATPLQLASGSAMRYVLQSVYARLDGIQHISVNYNPQPPRYIGHDFERTPDQMSLCNGDSEDSSSQLVLDQESWENESHQSFVTAPQSIMSIESGSSSGHSGRTRRLWWEGYEALGRLSAIEGSQGQPRPSPTTSGAADIGVSPQPRPKMQKSLPKAQNSTVSGTFLKFLRNRDFKAVRLEGRKWNGVRRGSVDYQKRATSRMGKGSGIQEERRLDSLRSNPTA